MKKVAIIIVNWNGLRLLNNCLKSVYKQSYKNFEVYFVDNGSVDGSVDFVKSKFPKANIIELKENTGFAKGSNLGIREAFKDKNVEYLVCLNNDTIVDKNWLKELIKTAIKDKFIGSVQSKIILGDGKRIHNTGMNFYKDLQGSEEGGLSRGFGDPLTKYNKEEKIFSGCAGAILYKRNILKKVGLFDEVFFTYVEDFDLGWRINKTGYYNMYCPKSKVIHLHSQTGLAKSPLKAYYIKRNIYLTAIKNMDLWNLLLFPFRDFMWNLNYIYKKKKSNEKSSSNNSKLVSKLISAYFSVILNLPRMLIKRYKVKKE